MIDPPPDYYALLGVSADADGDAIRTAYRALAKQLHPDAADGGGAHSTDQFIRIQEAYDVLRDPERRAEYDHERARWAEVEAAMRQQRAFLERQAQAAQARAANQPPPPPPKPRIVTRSRLFLVGAALLVVAASAFIAQQQRQRALESQITVVRVDPPRPPHLSADNQKRGLPPDLGALAAEMERLSHLQVARVEEAKKRMQAEVERAQKIVAPPPTLDPPSRPAALPRPPKIDCAGEGRAFVVTHDDDITSVSYNGGPAVRPAIRDLGTGIILVSKVEPTNRISIGFWKGDKNGTIILVSDATGKLFQTYGVDCTAAAF